VLRNLNPVITGDLLRQLDAMQPGELLALVSDGYPRHHANVSAIDIADISIESAAEAIFSVLPVACDDPSPVLCWLADPTDEAAVDVAFAVNGLASDAERRRVGMTTLDTKEFNAAMNDAVSTIRFPSDSTPWAFLIRVGGLN
jgi:L-fucose mutarotase